MESKALAQKYQDLHLFRNAHPDRLKTLFECARIRTAVDNQVIEHVCFREGLFLVLEGSALAVHRSSRFDFALEMLKPGDLFLGGQEEGFCLQADPRVVVFMMDLEEFEVHLT